MIIPSISHLLKNKNVKYSCDIEYITENTPLGNSYKRPVCIKIKNQEYIIL